MSLGARPEAGVLPFQTSTRYVVNGGGHVHMEPGPGRAMDSGTGCGARLMGARRTCGEVRRRGWQSWRDMAWCGALR